MAVLCRALSPDQRESLLHARMISSNTLGNPALTCLCRAFFLSQLTTHAVAHQPQRPTSISHEPTCMTRLHGTFPMQNLHLPALTQHHALHQWLPDAARPDLPTNTPSSPTCRGLRHQAVCTLPSPADSRLHQLQLLPVHMFSANGHCLDIYSHAKGKPRGSFFGWQRKKDS